MAKSFNFSWSQDKEGVMVGAGVVLAILMTPQLGDFVGNKIILPVRDLIASKIGGAV